jgi:hypothetical protein
MAGSRKNISKSPDKVKSFAFEQGTHKNITCILSACYSLVKCLLFTSVFFTSSLARVIFVLSS